MIHSFKGRIGPSEDLLTTQEAAKMLGVPIRALKTLIQKGVLEPEVGDTKKRGFRLSDLSALAQALSKKMDLSSIGHMALKALAIATRADRKINQLYEAVGFRVLDLPLEEASAVALYQRTQEALFQMEFSPDEVTEWARVFLAMSEEYLKLLELYTESEEPWKVFMDLGAHLSEAAPVEKFTYRKDLEAAWGLLRVGRNHLRQVSYFYARQKLGARKAGQLLPDAQLSTTETVLNLLFPR